MNLEYYDETTFQRENVEFPDEMFELAEKIQLSFNRVKLKDVNFKDYDGATPIIVGKDKKSLRFGVPLAETRVDRERGKQLYIVTITKFDSVEELENDCKTK
jgi:hypothetical protein